MISPYLGDLATNLQGLVIVITQLMISYYLPWATKYRAFNKKHLESLGARLDALYPNLWRIHGKNGTVYLPTDLP